MIKHIYYIKCDLCGHDVGVQFVNDDLTALKALPVMTICYKCAKTLAEHFTEQHKEAEAPLQEE